MKVDILAFGAHPDDVELGCGGSIALSVKLGKIAAIIDLTRGELSTRGNIETRQREAKRAADILGVSFRKNMNFRDGFFINDEIHQLKIIRLIREYKPDVVLCSAVTDRHIDHQKSSNLISDSCFLSGLKKIKTKSTNGYNQLCWRPNKIYHYIQWNDLKPDFVVDISSTLNLKMKSIVEYKSQFYNPKITKDNTPISSKNFTEIVRYRALNLGRLVGVDAAEGFNVERVPSIKSFDDLY
tara:strand:+ start:11792 stop:12511 length:720 start_codon:yes stop_codon:yes gene_type:complete